MPVWFPTRWFLHLTIAIYCSWYQFFFWLWSNQDVTGVFLDISKAFDKVWHDGILFKLKTYGVKRKLLNRIKNYLHERYERVVLNGQTSSWGFIKSGVPQGSVRGSLMFLVYINDLPDNIQSPCKIFADDTSLFSHVLHKDTSHDELNYDLQKVYDWAFQWKTQFNPEPQKISTRSDFLQKSWQQQLSSPNLQQNWSKNLSISKTPRIYIRGML